MVLTDEVYNQILYEGEHPIILSLPGMGPHTILLDGFSKTYAMTGWRLGYGVMPVELAAHMTRLMVNSNSCTAAFSQYAAIAALEGPLDEVRAMIAAFHERRDFIVAGLNEIPGFRCARPAGAFYVFPNVEGTGMASKPLADYLLDKAGVALLDGACFGDQGQGYLRLSYANSIENIGRALGHIREALAERQ
jgi:aspartate/methionine/tyrosine aminotransferase